MKVLLVNGSPHQHGCTYTALAEIAHTLQEEGIDSEIFWIGNKPNRRLHRLPRLCKAGQMCL